MPSRLSPHLTDSKVKEVGEEKDGEVKGEGEHAARVKESTVSDAHFRCHKGDKGEERAS